MGECLTKTQTEYIHIVNQHRNTVNENDEPNNNDNKTNNQMTKQHSQRHSKFDSSIFNRHESDECNSSNYNHCTSMTRLIASLEYYSTLDIDNDKDADAETFRQFMNDIYSELINDYIHFNNNHTQEL
eukprot:243908_1